MKLKVGDRVKIISGNEKGKLGYIKQIFHSQNKVIVKDLNFCFKHQKRSTIDEPGFIFKKESSINISNIMLYNSKFNRPTRVFVCKFNLNKNPERFSITSGTIME